MAWSKKFSKGGGRGVFSREDNSTRLWISTSPNGAEKETGYMGDLAPLVSEALRHRDCARMTLQEGWLYAMCCREAGRVISPTLWTRQAEIVMNMEEVDMILRWFRAFRIPPMAMDALLPHLDMGKFRYRMFAHSDRMFYIEDGKQHYVITFNRGV